MMGPLAILTVTLVITLSGLVYGKSFDWAAGNSSVWFSAAAYCETSTYLTRTYSGYTAGFKPYYKFDDPDGSDVQGFVGVLPSQSAIYVAFRGSTDITDWAYNIDTLKTSYPYCSGCEVHKGFRDAEVKAYPTIKSYVVSMIQEYPGYQVIITGHSLGAAMASLVSLDLLADKIVSPSSLRMFNFGSPRIGNDEFAAYASATLLDHNRVTHHKDMVPHCPMHERFTHMDGEWYQDDAGLQTCSGYEDPSCSYQWHITSIEDHMWYLGLYLDCASV